MNAPDQAISLDTVMSRRFDLDEQIATAQARHKAELAPLVEEMGLCETYIRTELLASGTQQWKSSSTGHSTYFTTKTRASVSDFDQVIDTVLAAAPPPACDDLTVSPEEWKMILDYVHTHALWAMLTKAVAKETVKEYIGVHSKPPAGVNYSEYRDLAWKRGQG